MSEADYERRDERDEIALRMMEALVAHRGRSGAVTDTAFHAYELADAFIFEREEQRAAWHDREASAASPDGGAR